MSYEKNNSYENLTAYPEINDLLLDFTKGIDKLLGDNLIGLYLFGSLTYGDFNINSSDIDLVAILHRQINQDEIFQIKNFHNKIAKRHVKWRERVECSYLPVGMLSNILPPIETRPYYGADTFYENADYGNEWIINNYLLYEHGIPLIGRSFQELTKPINITEVQKASVRDLFREWEPKISDTDWLDNPHYQSYIVMNLCRILYTISCSKADSKQVSAEWVKNQYSSKWHALIETAQKWEYGKIMSCKQETIAFIKFTIDEVTQSDIYKIMKEQGELTGIQ